MPFPAARPDSRTCPGERTTGELERLLDRAIARRGSLAHSSSTDAWRVVHGHADGIPGLVLERFGPVLIAQLHEGMLEISEDQARRLTERAGRHLGCSAAYRKVFPRQRSPARPELDRLHRDPRPWVGVPAPPAIEVTEEGMRFEIHPYDGYATGLFLEHRDNRRRVRQRAAGRRVLNAFAYTGAYSVAAALGGATETVSVDASRNYLAWARRNLARNGLELAGHTFIWSDVLDYYRRARRQGRRFDLVILDPPTFGRFKKQRRAFSLRDDLPELLAGALELLAADGLLLLCTNCRGLSLSRVERALARAAGRRRWRVLERPPLPEDFPDDPDFARSLWVGVG